MSRDYTPFNIQNYEVTSFNQMKFILSFFAVAFLACVTWLLASVTPVPSAIMALLLGTVFQIPLKKNEVGLAWSERQGLGWAIALLGFQMPINQLLSSGGSLLLLVVLGLLFTLLWAMILSRWMGLNEDQGIMVAVGNGICGAAAVMATQSVIKSNREDTTMAVALINVLGLLGILLTPALVLWLFPGQTEMAGHWIGNTLQSMPHVVAAAMASGSGVVEPAVWLKMIRILMLIPVLLLLASWQATSQRANQSNLPWMALVPVFVWGFLLSAGLATWGVVSEDWLSRIAWLSKGLMTMALVAMGAQLQWRVMRSSGLRLLAVGLLLFVGQLSFSAWLLHQM